MAKNITVAVETLQQQMERIAMAVNENKAQQAPPKFGKAGQYISPQ